MENYLEVDIHPLFTFDRNMVMLLTICKKVCLNIYQEEMKYLIGQETEQGMVDHIVKSIECQIKYL